jgi:hypothetical protein
MCHEDKALGQMGRLFFIKNGVLERIVELKYLRIGIYQCLILQCKVLMVCLKQHEIT